MLEITTENTATYSGQSNFTASAQVGDCVVGRLEYVKFQGKPSIAYIEVEFECRRQGIATLLVQHLQSLFPDQEIDWGMCSDDGFALFKAVNRTEPVPEVVAAQQELHEVHRKLTELNTKSAAHEVMADRSPHDLQTYQAWSAQVRDEWNGLHDRAYDLDTTLRNRLPIRAMVVMPEGGAPLLADFQLRSAAHRVPERALA